MMNTFRDGVKISFDDVVLVLLAWLFFWIPLGDDVAMGSFLAVDVVLVELVFLLIGSLVLGLVKLKRVGTGSIIWMLAAILVVSWDLVDKTWVSPRLWSISVAVVVSVLVGRYLQERKLYKVMGWVLTLVLAVHAQWAAAQFMMQNDLGLRLLGESVLEIGKPGVATFTGWLEGGSIKMLRAYGPYDHPNILGGMMIMGMILLINLVGWKYKWRMSTMVVMAALAAGVAVSFSRLTLLAVILTWLIYAGGAGWDKRGIVLGAGYVKEIAVTLLAILVVAPLWWWRMIDVNDEAVSERLMGYEWSWEIMRDNDYWRGVGMGNYPEAVGKYLENNNIEHQEWQVDYVHSVPLLMMAELGIGTGLLFILFTMGAAIRYLGARWWWLIPITPLLVFDHYFLTQPVGQLMVLWVVLLLPGLQGDRRLGRE